MIRFKYSLALLAILVVTMLLVCVMCGALYDKEYNFSEETYTVQAGDSMWFIASKYCPKEMNVHQYIDLVMKRNDMDSIILR